MKAKGLLMTAAGLVLVVGGYLWWSKSSASSAAASVTTSAKSTNAQAQTSSQYENLLDADIPWQQRLETVKGIESASLSPLDRDYLYSTFSHQPKANTEDWWVVVNEIMDRLARIDEDSARYTSALLATMNDKELNEVVRDYAVQHLGNYYMPVGESLIRRDSSSLNQVLETFQQLVTDPELAETSIPGTTLNVIVAMKHQDVEPELISSTVSHLTPWIKQVVTGDSAVPLSTRVTAINSAGDFQLSSLTDTIRTLFNSEDLDPTIRLNAIAALGQLGTSDDLAALEALASSSSKFRFAAQSALKNLSN